MRKHLCPALAILFLNLFARALCGQMAATPGSVFTYLTSEETATLRLELDLQALIQNRKNAGYLPATLIASSGHSFPLEVRTRGKFRRRKCEIPPMKLKFLKEGLQSAQLDTLNEIKLVLPCSGSPEAEDLIIREYIAYRMFESISPVSARARLIHLELKGGADQQPQQRIAMLVEHEEEITQRLHSAAIQEWGIKAERLNQDQAALMILFQYMIGNTDWDLTACRNILLLQPNEPGKITAVPFDFDFSGLVGAPYASPNSTLGLKRVKDRALMAFDLDKQPLQRAKETLVRSKSTLYDWCNNPVVPKTSAEEMTRFLDIFFEAISGKGIPAKIEFPAK